MPVRRRFPYRPATQRRRPNTGPGPGGQPGPNYRPPPGGNRGGAGGGRNQGGRPGGRGGRPGGGGRGGRPGGRTRRRGQTLSLRERAQNDVMTAYQPMLDAIRRAQEEAVGQYTTDAARVKDIYGALLTQLQPLGGSMTQGSQQIASNLSDQIGGLANLLGSTVPGVPQSEITAGTNAVGTTGSGALQVLANDLQRNLGYNTSAQRQGGIEQMTASRNYLQDLQNLLDEYQTRSLDLRNEMPGLQLQRLGELQDQRFQQRMAQREFALRRAAAAAAAKGDKAFSKYLQGSIRSSAAGGGGGGRRGGGGGGGGPGPGGGGGAGGGGRRWQPTWQPGTRMDINRMLEGDVRWGQLTPKEQTAIRTWINKNGQKFIRELSNIMPGLDVQMPTQQIIRMLIEYARRQSLAQDPTPGPAPGR